jgi:hypothetical protein
VSLNAVNESFGYRAAKEVAAVHDHTSLNLLDIQTSRNSVNDSEAPVHRIGHEAKLAAEGLVTAAVLYPLNGAVQAINLGTDLYNKRLNLTLPEASPLEFPNQKEVDHSVAGKVGEVAGLLLDVLAIHAPAPRFASMTRLAPGWLVKAGETGMVLTGAYSMEQPHHNRIQSREISPKPACAAQDTDLNWVYPLMQ